jgi:phage/plasmid-like protein (TIGR03299 family)
MRKDHRREKMSAEVESMAYAGPQPWHGFGNPVTDKMSPEEMKVAAGCDWEVRTVPLTYKVNDRSNGKEYTSPDLGLVRATDGQYLSTVGKVYKPIQNETVFAFFKKYTKAGSMRMETAGSLWHGKYIWALARLDKDFKLGKEDEIRSYLLLANPHVFGRAFLMKYTAIRVVCWNTFSAALGADLLGGAKSDTIKQVFRMSHALEFSDDRKAEAEAVLGLAGKRQEQLKEAVTLLSKKKATPEKTEEWFCEVLRFDPKEADKKKDGTIIEPRMLPKLRQALESSPGAQLNTALGTWWGNYNALTYVIDHETGRDRETAMKSAWFGSRAKLKQRALSSAIEYAKKAKAA